MAADEAELQQEVAELLKAVNEEDDTEKQLLEAIEEQN